MKFVIVWRDAKGEKIGTQLLEADSLRDALRKIAEAHPESAMSLILEPEITYSAV